MKNLSKDLLALQNLELGPASSAAEQRIEALRRKVPESLLTQFDRWMARDRKAVAVVRHGVCCECHIGVAVGILGALTFDDEVQRCGNCGRFLYLPEDEPVQLAAPSAEARPATGAKAKPARRRRKAHGT